VAGDPGAAAASGRRTRRARLVFPALLVLVTVGLSASGLSGTSVGVLTATQKADPALLVGTPRPIRFDEWGVATPFIVAQSHHGFSPVSRDSVGDHNFTVLEDVPTTDWSTYFKPWDIPVLVLDLEHGFAARWWMMSLILVLGAYLLLLALTDRTDIAVLFSLAIWASPFFQWWYASDGLDIAGMGMLSLGAFLYSLRASSTPRRAGWLALAAYSAIGFAILLYPPFQIPTALVLGVVGVCYIVGRWQELGMTARRLIVDIGALALVIGGTLGAYYLHSRGTIAAINDTVYPGHRRVTGGGTSLLQLLSAPFGLTLAQHGDSLTFTNQSEISSFILLGPFAMLQIHRVRLHEFARRWRVLLAGSAGVFVLISIWYFVSLPPVLASLLLLDRVEPQRAILGVGLGGILLMAVFCAAELEQRDEPQAVKTGGGFFGVDERQRRILIGAAVCAVLAFAMYLWGGRNLREAAPGLHLGLWEVGSVSAAAAIVVFLTSARRVILGGVALVVFGATVSLTANPLYRGLGPLTSSPLLATVSREAVAAPDASHRTWLSFADLKVNTVLIASGLKTLSAPDVYPKAKTWKILDPHRRFRVVWDRYANLTFVPAPSGAPPTLTLGGTYHAAVRIAIDPCGSEARRLGVGFVVSGVPLSAPCLRLDVHTGFAGSPVYIYRS